MLGRLIAEVPPPQVSIPAIRVALALLTGALTTLGLRRGGHGFLHNLVYGIVNAPVRVAQLADRIIHGTQQGAAQDTLAQQNPVASFFEGMTHMLGYASFTVSYLSAHVLQSLLVLRHDVIPKLVRAAARPIVITAHAGVKLGHRSLAEVAAVETVLQREINALRSKVAFLEAGAVALPGEIAREFPRIGLGSLGRRLRRLEKLVGIGALAGILVSVIARRLPWHSCSNTKKVGKGICGADSQLLDSLLADLLLIGGTISLVEFTRECQTFEDGLIVGMRAFIREFRHVGG